MLRFRSPSNAALCTTSFAALALYTGATTYAEHTYGFESWQWWFTLILATVPVGFVMHAANRWWNPKYRALPTGLRRMYRDLRGERVQ